MSIAEPKETSASTLGRIQDEGCRMSEVVTPKERAFPTGDGISSGIHTDTQESVATESALTSAENTGTKG